MEAYILTNVRRLITVLVGGNLTKIITRGFYTSRTQRLFDMLMLCALMLNAWLNLAVGLEEIFLRSPTLVVGPIS